MSVADPVSAAGRSLLAVAAALVVLAGRPAGADERETEGIGPEQYRRYCQSVAAAMLVETYPDPAPWVTRHRKLAEVSHAALIQAILWQWTGESRHAAGAERFLAAVAGQRSTIREADFFTVYPFARTCQILAEEGLWSPETEQQARRFILDRFRARDVGDHNQALTRACGLELAAQLYPQAAQADAWRGYAREVWQVVLRQGDITENAPNYNRIDAVYLFLLGDLLQRGRQLQDPRLRAMYARWREQLTPSGAIPAYGDSGTGLDDLAGDWPIRHRWADWAAAFERAGREYDDGAFRWAAARLFRRGVRSEPLGRDYGDVLALSSLMLAADWTDPSLTLRPPPAGPHLQRRREPQPGGTIEHALDKIVLNPSRRSGAPYLLSDLFVRGPHAHVNQHGAVQWLEYDNVPLAVSLGYNNRQPQHANLLLIRDADERFPHSPPLAADQWHTADLPASRLPAVPGKPHHRRLTELALRVASRRGVTFTADNLRLAGPAGDLLLEGFESPAGWTYDPHRTGEAREGDYALVWQLPPGAHAPFHRGVDARLAALEFDVRQYPRLRIDWKLSDNTEQARPFILRCGADYHAHLLQLTPVLTAAEVASAGDDQYARLEFREWFAEDTAHTRELVLTAEGALVVVDRLEVGPLAEGRQAGPIWQLGPRRDPLRGPNWFHARGPSTELLAVFSTAPGREFGVQAVDVWSIEGQRTIYARQTLRRGTQPVFISVLMPVRPGDDAARRAAQVRLDSDASMARVRFESGGHEVAVRVGGDERFEVTRP